MKKAEQGVADKASINVASEAAHGLLELIGDILDIAQIESGRMSLNQQRTQLMTLVQSTVRVFEGMAQQKGIQMSAELDPKINLDVLIDPLRFRQILSNLLSNAIKFTADGLVSLGAQALVEGDRLNVQLWVQDTGIGISVQDQQRLFSLFIQGSNNQQSARSGSGLGLVISRNLCEMMGGQLHLSSVLGHGTRVDVTLALATTDTLPARTTPAADVAPQGRALSILVVDDYPANRLLLARQLSFLGHHITTAEDGVQGFELWRAGHYDGVITDCNMPFKNGYQLAQDIRAQERERGLAPCLLLGFTANAQPEETARCRQAGMDGCLFKPTGLDDLRAALASRAATQGLPPAPTFDLSTLVALTGDDRPALVELLLPLLESLESDQALLPALLSRADFAKLHDLAHRAKGGARMVKALELITCCETLEQACEQRDRHALGAAVEGVSKAIDGLHHGLSVFCNQP